MKKKKWPVVVICIVAVLAVLAGIFVTKFRNSSASAEGEGNSVYVFKVADLMGVSASDQGLNQRYAGVVEPQSTENVQKDDTRTVSEIYVQADDQVKAGDPLFRYDIDEMNLELQQKQLELEKIENQIITQQNQIDELTAQAQSATGDTLLEYTIQINEAQLTLKQYEYDRDSKQTEITKTQQSIDNAIVVSPIDGTVRSVNTSSADNGTGQQSAFIVIVANGEYRIKGLVNEQNAYQISAGSEAIVRSRVDETRTWSGTVSLVDTSNPDTGSSDQNGMYYYYDTGNSMTSTSKYPFYVDLSSTDGLMMGQHVYIEITSAGAQVPHTDGVWLYDGYFFYGEDDPSQAYVWADNGKGKIEKRAITLGEYDDAAMMYEVTEGLTQDDWIAYPDGTVTEGMSVISGQ